MNKNSPRTTELRKKQPKIPREQPSYIRNKINSMRTTELFKKWTKIPHEQQSYVRNEQKFSENNRAT